MVSKPGLLIHLCMLKSRRSILTFLLIFGLASFKTTPVYASKGPKTTYMDESESRRGLVYSCMAVLLITVGQIAPAILVSGLTNNKDLKSCAPQDFGLEESGKLLTAKYLFISSPPSIIAAIGFGTLGAYLERSAALKISDWQTAALFTLSTFACAISAAVELAGSALTIQVYERVKRPIIRNCLDELRDFSGTFGGAYVLGFASGGLQGLATLAMCALSTSQIYQTFIKTLLPEQSAAEIPTV